MRLLLISLFGLAFLLETLSWSTDFNKFIEQQLLKDYNRKHRPVRKDSTTMQIQVYLLISHVEKVDEQEQTLLLHGILWASWVDEYLQWDPKKHNNTLRLAIETWKIWLPALSVYNSARGNFWHLHMGGLPASITNDGNVWVAGSFSFFVTCMFDFTNYPYDEQECPIVIADWIYDLSRVNLSDPLGNTKFNKPIIALSHDPLNNENSKNHVAGWEVKDTWRRQCYCGPNGCMEEPTYEQPEWFWSMIEFGIKIKRRSPYFGITIILPCLITSILTMSIFWIDNFPLAIACTVLNIILQALFGWDLIKNMPPGSGGVPRIVSFYGFNLSMTAIAYAFHVVASYLQYSLPKNLEFPFRLTNITERLRQMRTFKIKGLSFDPQLLLLDEGIDQDLSAINKIETDGSISHNVEIIEKDTVSNDEKIFMENSHSNNLVVTQESEIEHVAQQLHILRRLIFFVFLLMYVISIPICLF